MSLQTIGTIEIPGCCRQLFRSWRFRSKEPPHFRGAHRSRLRRGHRSRRPQAHRDAAGIPSSSRRRRGRWDGPRNQPWGGKFGLGRCRAVWKRGPFSKPALGQMASRSCRSKGWQSPPALETNPTAPRSRSYRLDGRQHYSLDLPGRPRWCVTDAAFRRVFLAIREPSMVLVARLPELDDVQHWKLPVGGAHGLDIDHQRGRLYVACDDGALVEVDIGSGKVSNQWPIAGAPDVTFFNPTTGLVHVAIGKPGLVQSIDPRTGANSQVLTGPGAHTTALAAPNLLYVFSISHRGALAFEDA